MWTDELGDALGFPEATEAITAARSIGPENIEIIFSNSRGQILFGTRLPLEK